jgi:NTE family protein
MTRSALVLGGGGLAGAAWLTGLAASWRRCGLDPANATLILGTSAGAAVGALIALRLDLQGQVDRYRAAHVRAVAHAGSKAPAFASPQQRPFYEVMARAQAAGRDDARVVRELCELARRSGMVSEDDQLSRFRYLAQARWPGNYVCTALDVDGARLALLSAETGGTLQQGVAAAVSVPGVHSPVSLASRPYADGGCLSPTHADLAAGCERILVVRTTELADRELQALQDKAVSVAQIALDWDRAPFGRHEVMSPQTLVDAVELGLAQGLASYPEAARFLAA